VRDCTSFGLPAHIRFSVRKDEENEVLLQYLTSFS
jgi:histidinol-phosphate/aromatic aminotransferase/cobyric acid decarboxylase-like protein